MEETYVVIHFYWDTYDVVYAGSDRAKADEVYSKTPKNQREMQIWENGTMKDQI